MKDIYNKRLDKIEGLNKKNDYNNLKYTVLSSDEEFNFDKLEDPIVFLNNIKKKITRRSKEYTIRI